MLPGGEKKASLAPKVASISDIVNGTSDIQF
jgi:hypothetical protein